MFTFNQNTYEIHLTRGDTLTLDFQFDGEGLSEGDKLYYTLKKSPSDTKPLIEKEATLIDSNIGRVVFSSGDTSVLPFGRYEWDIRIFYANGEVTSPIYPAAFYVDAVVGQSGRDS